MDDLLKALTGGKRKRKHHGRKKRGHDCCCLLEDVFDSPCFVATASYGDATAPEVKVLRAYRDQVLRRSPAGRLFIRTYYGLGPYGARVVRGRPRVKAAVRYALRPAVSHARRRTR